MKTIIMNIDYSDEVWLRDRPMTEEDIEELLGLCATHGCLGVNWRVTCLGSYQYRTSRPNRLQFDRDEFMQSGGVHGVSPILSERERQAEQRARLARHQLETLDRFDPLAAARHIARAKGLQFYVWFDIFDDHYPGYLSHFLHAWPQYQWMGQDGRHRYDYLRSYAFPEAREDQLGYIREILKVKPDGFYLATSHHSGHVPRTVDEDYFGYEDPVAERFLERYGTDIRETDEFDREAWHRIKGEFVTEFLREVKAELSGAGAALCVGSHLGDYTTFRYPYFSSNVVARYHNDWRTWVEEGTADSLMVGDYQALWRWDDSWRRYGEPVKSAGLPADVAAEIYAGFCNGRCELYYFSGWMHPPHFPECLRIRGQTLRGHPADGIAVHEAMSVEQANAWEQLELLVAS